MQQRTLESMTEAAARAFGAAAHTGIIHDRRNNTQTRHTLSWMRPGAWRGPDGKVFDRFTGAQRGYSVHASPQLLDVSSIETGSGTLGQMAVTEKR